MCNRLIGAAITGLVGSLLAWAPVPTVQAQTSDQLRFGSPEDALKALQEATKSKDHPQLRKILGVEAKELASGDEVQDRTDLDEFAKNLAAAAKLVPEGDDRVILHVGPMGYPFPVPLVRAEGKWYFDTPAGEEEMLNRRIGENELKAIAVCRGCVEAQRDYYDQDWDDDGVMEYAQRIGSTPGKKDGLYWETKDDEPTSPLGPMIAEAQAEGYGHGKATTQPTTQATSQPAAGPRPYHGYHYKILKQQGEHAPGGKHDYVINGHMVAGFAFVAWPATWGKSGVMTFVVNSNGKVYQKDLGEKTAELAKAITEYDPDDTWSLVKD
jgi:hypothetical protein